MDGYGDSSFSAPPAAPPIGTSTGQTAPTGQPATVIGAAVSAAGNAWGGPVGAALAAPPVAALAATSMVQAADHAKKQGASSLLTSAVGGVDRMAGKIPWWVWLAVGAGAGYYMWGRKKPAGG